MSRKVTSELIDDIESTIQDNTTKDITPAEMRGVLGDLVDSALTGIADCRGSVKLILVGNSLAMNPVPVESGWPYQLTQQPVFAGRSVEIINTAEFGTTLADWESNFDDNIAPEAPGPDDVVVVIIVGGTNEFLIGSDALAAVNSWYTNTSDLSEACRDLGMFTVVTTVTPRATADATAAAYYEACRTIGNHRLVTRGHEMCDMVVDWATLMPDNQDTGIYGEGTHHTQEGRNLIARHFNACLLAKAAFPGGPFIGRNRGDVPSNGILVETPRSYSGAQGFGESVLNESSLSWNLDTQQVARLLLTGDATLPAPTNPRIGFPYRLTVVQNSVGGHTLTLNAAYVGVPSLPETANSVTTLRFYCDGVSMLYDGPETAPSYVTVDLSDPTLVIHDEFTVDGYNVQVIPFDTFGRIVAGTPPQTVNTPGGNWSGDTGFIVVTAESGEARINGSGMIYKSSGSANGIVSNLMKFTDSSGSGHAGPRVRVSDSSHFIQWGGRGDGTCAVWKFNGPDYSTLYEGSFTYDATNGNDFKVIMAGITLEFWIDGTLKKAVTETMNSTVTNHGSGRVNSTPERFLNCKIWAP